jgi:hypothetical protein
MRYLSRFPKAKAPFRHERGFGKLERDALSETSALIAQYSVVLSATPGHLRVAPFYALYIGANLLVGQYILLCHFYRFLFEFKMVKFLVMGRKPNEFEAETVTLTMIEPTRRYLDRLVAGGLYGNNVAEAAKIIVLEKIRQLIDAGRLVEMPPMEPKERAKKRAKEFS